VRTEVLNPSGITSKVVRFDFDSDRPRSPFHNALDQIAKSLAAHLEIQHLRIEGHTDDVGPENYNQGLSERRARNVALYLRAKGIKGARLETVGFGETRPSVPGQSAQARASNRRVEFVIVE
jgi:outer membrane protein OmpA-like peptidoglycan-associated protein